MNKLIVILVMLVMILGLGQGVAYADEDTFRDELILAGIEVGDATYWAGEVFADADVRANWEGVGFITVTDPPLDVTLTAYGETAMEGIDELITDLTNTGADPTESSRAAFLLYLDEAFRGDWESQGFITVTLDGSSRVIDINITPLGEAAIPIILLENTHIVELVELHNAIITSSLQDEFALMYGFAVVDQVLSNQSYIREISGVVSYIKENTVGFIQDDFLYELAATAALHAELDVRGLGDIFVAVSGIAVVDQDPVANPVYRGYLAGVVNGVGYTVEDYLGLMGMTNNVHLALDAGTLRADFALMYKVAEVDQILTNSAYFSIIQGVASFINGSGSYDLADWTEELSKSASLHRAIDTNDLRDIFEGVSGISVADQVAVTTHYRGNLAYIMNYPGYVEADYIASLSGLKDLHLALDAGNLRADFAVLYLIPEAGQVLSNYMYIQRIQSVAGYIDMTDGYELADWIAELAVTADLHTGLDTNDLRDTFADIYGIPVELQVPYQSYFYHNELSGIASYIIENDSTAATFLAELVMMRDLHEALEADTLREYFAFLYDIGEVDQVFTNSTYADEMRGIASWILHNPGYDLDDEWIAGLASIANLHTKLGTLGLRDMFAAISGISVADQLAVTDQYLWYMLGIVGYADHVEADYLGIYSLPNDVHLALDAGTLRADFAIFYAVPEVNQVLSNVLYVNRIKEVANLIDDRSGYELSDWIAELTAMASLHRALDSNSLRDYFAGVSGISVASQLAVSEQYKYYLLNYVINRPGYVEADYLALLSRLKDVHLALDAGTLRADLAIFYGIAEVDQVLSNSIYFGVIQGAVAYIDETPGYELTDWTAELAPSASLHEGLDTNDLRDTFVGIYGVSVVNQVAYNFLYRRQLSGIISYIISEGSNVGAFLAELVMIKDIHQALDADTLRADFALLYDIAEVDQLLTNSTYVDEIRGIAAWIIDSPWYDFNDWITGLAAVANLHTKLGTYDLRDMCAGISGIPVAEQLAVSDAYLRYLLGTVGSANHVEAVYLAYYSEPNDIHLALDEGTLRADFALFWGVPEVEQVLSNRTYIDRIQQVVYYIRGRGGYELSDWTAELSALGGLHRALDANDLRECFAGVSGISVADQLAITEQYKYYIINYVINQPGYVEEGYIASLSGLKDLHLALDPGVSRADFAVLYLMPEGGQILSNNEYIQRLQRIAGYIDQTDGYEVADWIAELAVTADLHAGLDTNNLRDTFADIYGIPVEHQEPYHDYIYHCELSGIASYVISEGSNAAAFLGELVTIRDLHEALEADALRGDFELLYGIAEEDQVLTISIYVDTIKGIAAWIIDQPGYELADWIVELTPSASLHTALGDNNLRNAFVTMYGISVADQLVVTLEYVSYLAGIINQSGYVEIDYLNRLEESAKLHDALDYYDLRANFTIVSGIAVVDQDPVANPDYEVYLKYVVNVPGYNLADYIENIGGPSGLPIYEYDIQLRITKTTFQNGDYIITEYYGLTDNKFEDRYFGPSWVWKQTIQYWEAFPNVRAYRWIADPDGIDGDDIVFDIYDESGRLIKQYYDNDDFIITEYYDATTNKFEDRHFASDWTWKETTRYWEAYPDVINYKWIPDPDGVDGDDVVFEVYDTQGRLITQYFDNDDFIITEYYGLTNNKFEDRHFGAGWVWQETTRYWEFLSNVRAYPDGIDGDDVVTEIYDEEGRVVKQYLDNDDFIITEYYGTTTDKFEDRHFAADWTWQETTRYWEDHSNVPSHKWLADPDGIPNGNVVYEEYNTIGECIWRQYDDGTGENPLGGSMAMILDPDTVAMMSITQEQNETYADTEDYTHSSEIVVLQQNFEDLL